MKEIRERIINILPFLFGFFSFLFFSDIKILNPLYISWLLEGDPAQHYLGWSTFRNTPLLQWPLGVNYNYGMEVSNSIVYTDSIPIIAILFKFLAYILPQEFQYTGAWILMCYMLNSYFGYKIFYKITGNMVCSLITGIILSCLPCFTWRTEIHFALSAQFLILAAFYLHISNPAHNHKKWILLICFTAGIHAYLLAMVLFIYLFNLSYKIYKKEDRIIKQMVFFAISTILCIITMDAMGYFTIKSGIPAYGYGEFKTDIVSILNPFFSYNSNFIPAFENGNFSSEGICYLGIGGIIALLSAAMMKIFFFRDKINKKYLSIFIPVLLMFIFSLSNNISFMGEDLVTIPFSQTLLKICNIFRASGRFSWPLIYLGLIFSLLIIYKNTNKNKSVIFILLATIQIIDLYGYGPHYKETKNDISKEVSHSINSENYNINYKKFKAIVMLAPDDFENKIFIVYTAAKNNLSVNGGYLARYDWKKVFEQKNLIATIIATKTLKPDTLYLLGKSGLSLSRLCTNNKYTCQDGVFGKIIYFITDEHIPNN